LEARFGAPDSARLDWRPTTTVTLDEDRATTVLRLLDALDENDDIQNVYANFEIPDAVVQRLSG
jgi:transcriptional/translational regulatory protein YebC/TACO1